MRSLHILFILNWFGALSQQINPQNILLPELKSDTLKSPNILNFIQCDARFPGGVVELKNYIKNFDFTYDWSDTDTMKRGYVTFVVETDGTLTEIKIHRGINPELDDIMLRMIEEMPNWDPACDLNGPVRSRNRLPITFIKPL